MSSTRNPASTVSQSPGEPFPERFALSGTSSDVSPGIGSSVSSDVNAAGAAWLASTGTYPRSTLALWADRPTAPVVLPCGSAFDVVNTPAIFGRHMLDRLWGEGPGSGPVAVYGGRILLFAAPGTAQRLPSLLKWEEWGSGGTSGRGRSIPPLLCHGTGDAVTVPAALNAAPASAPAHCPDSRWLVAPDTRRPWLPGPEVLLWAAVRAARAAGSGGGGPRADEGAVDQVRPRWGDQEAPLTEARISIFPPADQGAKVYDVSRRR
ncbi:bifunctional DNA primase/polymerase [Streptomyces sp. 2A115]|uniref:bifunctional DNA primase/polymerase n=1 Tax=Streptomyces sp. 2A115 TaxID=3457439 RepID=UPI003FD1241E